VDNVSSFRGPGVGRASGLLNDLGSRRVASGGVAEKKSTPDWGCLYLLLAPVVVTLIAAGDGGWIVGGLTVAAIVVVLIVTIGELLG
jgi:hypothetical protein